MAITPQELAERHQMVTIAREELYGEGNIAVYTAALIDMAHCSVDPLADVHVDDAKFLMVTHQLRVALDERIRTVIELGQFTISET